jgi:hypothetical protein
MRLARLTEAILAKTVTISDYNPNERTLHGDNIANEIQGEDAYGVSNTLTPADLWNILDNIQSHLLDNGKEDEAVFVGNLMMLVTARYPDIET